MSLAELEFFAELGVGRPLAGLVRGVEGPARLTAIWPLVGAALLGLHIVETVLARRAQGELLSFSDQLLCQRKAHR